MASPWHRPDEAKEISDVNVVPLADVSLVLLIILLVLSPMMAQSSLHVRTAAKARETEAPPPPEPPYPEPPPELVLVVDLGPGGIAVGDRLIGGTAELTVFLREELSRRSDRKVFLAPHPDVTHGRVVEALEAARASGAESVALVQTLEP